MVVEAKLSYKAEAEEKLRCIYGRLAKNLFPTKRISLVQVTKGLPLGLDFTLTPIEELLHAPGKYHLVHHV